MPETTSATATAASSASGKSRAVRAAHAGGAPRLARMRFTMASKRGSDTQVIEVRVVPDPLEIAATVLDRVVEHLESVVDVTQDRVGAGDVVVARERVRSRLAAHARQDRRALSRSPSLAAFIVPSCSARPSCRVDGELPVDRLHRAARHLACCSTSTKLQQRAFQQAERLVVVGPQADRLLVERHRPLELAALEAGASRTGSARRTTPG